MSKRFIGYYRSTSMPIWMQQRAVHGMVNLWKGSLIHEIEEVEDFDDGCFSLREAKRLAVKYGATMAVYSMGVLSRNLKLFQEVREQVPVMTCEYGGRNEQPNQDREVHRRW